MDGFSDKHCYDFLIGKSVHEICLSNHQIKLNIEDGIWIEILAIDSFLSENKSFFDKIYGLPNPWIGQIITKIEICSKDSMSIEFGSIFSIILPNDTDKYESVVFRNGDDFIVA